MILTLYKNCILNDNYNEVFDLTLKTVDGVESSVFTDYLKSLKNTVINLLYLREKMMPMSKEGISASCLRTKQRD